MTTNREKKTRKPLLGALVRKKPSVRPVSIASRIVAKITELLANKELRVGDFLGTEVTISETFGASRFPVREALSRLEALGIVEIRRGAGGGIWIAHGKPDHFADLLAIHLLLADITLEELFEARLAIVPKAAEHAAKHATAQEVAELGSLLDEVERLRHDFSAALDVLMTFHLKLVELSKLRTLTALNRSLCSLLKDLHERYPPPILTTSRPAGTYGGMRNLRAAVAKIGEGDSAGASEIMRKSIIGHRDAILALARQEQAAVSGTIRA
jgi:GntR family transcriptional repressor for pyruvate dehydrogenase complex